MLNTPISKDDHSKLSPSDQAHYQAGQDGTFYLQVTGANGWGLENVHGLKQTISALRGDLAKAEGASSAYRLQDGTLLDATKAREALEKVAQMANWKSDDRVKEQIAEITKQLAEKHAGEIKPKDERIAKLDGAVRKLLINERVTSILANKASPRLLLPAILPFLKVEEDDKGEFSIRVVDERGNPRVTMKPGSTSSMELEEFVLGTKSDPELSHAWYGSGSSGGGAAGNGASNANGSRFRISEQDAREHPERYQRVRAEAEKAGQSVELVSSAT